MGISLSTVIVPLFVVATGVTLAIALYLHFKKPVVGNKQPCGDSSDCPSDVDCGRYNTTGADAQLVCCPSTDNHLCSDLLLYCTQQPPGNLCGCDASCSSGHCVNGVCQ